MLELAAILFLIGLGYGVKGLADNVRGDLRKSREAKVKEAAKAAGGKLSKHQRAAVARQHTRGWWAREVTGGFPAARTGWHAGWIAHKTALARQQIIREEARTEHAETQTSFRKDLAEHQKRQAAARAELEKELAAQQAKGSPATGRSAVQKAADEVSRKREEKAARERKTPPAATGTETAVPPLPADSVGEARDVRNPAKLWVFNSPESTRPSGPREDARPDDGSWLRPGDRRCEGCGGRGSALGGTCPACRGFGSAPASPMSPVAPADAVCTACGNTGRPGDPVLADPGGNIHLSHAKEGQVRYWDALNRMRQAEREPGPDAARWDPDIDGTGPPAPSECVHCHRPIRQSETSAIWWAVDGHPVGDDADCLHEPPGFGSSAPASPTTTEGAPVTDTNYTAVLADAKAAADQAEQDAVTATQRRVTAENHADAMQAANVKGNCLSAQMDFVDRLKAQETAAKASGEQAVAVSDHLQREHGGIQAAVNDAPISEPAEPAFYGGS